MFGVRMVPTMRRLESPATTSQVPDANGVRVWQVISVVKVQSFSHPSPATVLPSSHSSPASTMELPQSPSITQLAEQPSPSVVLPSSHSSPSSRIPLPHSGVTSLSQVAEQPSPSMALPSSHSSSPSTTPLPQMGSRSLSLGQPARPTASRSTPGSQK
jgi:hypothetical protein